MTIQPRKKILFLITKSNWGGAQRYVYDLATNLDRDKFEPVVALGGNGPLNEMLKNAGIRTVNLAEMQNSTSVKQSWRTITELWKLFRTEKPTIVHLNSSIAGLLGAIVGRAALVPNVIFTAHGWAFNEDRSYWQKLIIKFLHWSTVLLSHRTIAVSSAIVKQMNWPWARRHMKIINPGRTIGPMYTPAESRTKIIDFCPRLLPYQNDYWVVCLGELHPIKRHRVLIEAFAKSITHKPNSRLILIGEGSEREAIIKQINELGLANNIFLLGNIVEAGRFLKAFNLFVLVSKSESYGYVLVEAGLAHVPIIATNVGGIPDIIVNGEDGILIRPDRSDLLVQALAEIQKNSSLAEQRADHLQQKLSSRTVAKMARQIESLYSH